MAKFFGVIGYAETVETAPGVHVEKINERPYYGDLTRVARYLRDVDKLNDDIDVNNNISIVADAYAYDHIFEMRYVKWAGASWKVTSVEVQRPRLILSIGGLYNESKN